jgi:NADH-quinone oxidoreductase subunit I
MQKVNRTYWSSIWSSFSTLSHGLKITIKHFYNAFKYKNRGQEGVEDSNYFEHQNGIFTLQYPSESIPVPDNGRYRLHNEIEDCIVCDKCAKICPVSCIEIDSIKSPTEIRKASDGSSIRLYAGKFEIDMAKCMFCGLCTTVCPTECLTMTKTFDFSEFDVKNLAYEFSDLTNDMADRKRQEYLDYMEAKKQTATKTAVGSQEFENSKTPLGVPKRIVPIIKPKKTDE